MLCANSDTPCILFCLITEFYTIAAFAARGII